MKAHLAKLSLALLSAVFLLGCQEQGSEPVGLDGLGPEFDPGGGGKGGSGKKGGSVLADLVMPAFNDKDGNATNGLVTPTAQVQVVEFKDGKKTIEFSKCCGVDGIELAFNLNETHINAKVGAVAPLVYNTDVCLQSGKGSPTADEKNELFALLLDAERLRNFFVTIDKDALNGSSDVHKIQTGWNESPEEGGRSLKVGTFSERPGSIMTVTTVEGNNITDGFEFWFTGGSVRLRSAEGRPHGFNLTCPNEDFITMELVERVAQ